LQNVIAPIVAQTSGLAISTAIDSAIADAFGNGQFMTVGPTGIRLNFAADPTTARAEQSPSGIRSSTQTANDAFAKVLGQQSMPTKAPVGVNVPNDWSVWFDLRGTGWKVDDTSVLNSPPADITGHQLNATAGIGRKLTPDLLVGLLAGGEFFKYDVNSFNGTLKGEGASVGGYVARVFGNIRADAGVAWSNIRYEASAGTATGLFTGSRWLGTGAITGNYRWADYLLEPSVRVFVLSENEGAWTDSLGTLQPERNFQTGRASAGGKIGKAVEFGDLRLLPYFGLYGDYVFMSDNALPVGGFVAAIHSGWAARLTAGIGVNGPNGISVTSGGELGGLGSDYKVWSALVRAHIPF
jgi:hypothetical protein